MKYAIDLPNQYGSAWVNYDYYETKEEALRVARTQFGADEEGRIGLISKLPDDEG